jgi:hypothetical protein
MDRWLEAALDCIPSWFECGESAANDTDGHYGAGRYSAAEPAFIGRSAIG